MCGIAGILYGDRHRLVDAGMLRAMADAIAHRGPDAEGFWLGEGVGLAHRRLSIIDLAGGDQPMANEDGSVQVVFNGEIYNYRALRDELLSRGHVLRSQGDTEVLVHLYEDHGAALVEKLRGMFAFAIWDAKRRRVLLARDRVGLKPLYYYRDRERLLFGSEIKAILACPGVDRSIDQQSLEAYLAFGFVPGERSIFKQIKKLAPAHVLELDADAPLVGTPRRYWRLEAAIDETLSSDDWVQAIRGKLAETVAIHRIADVPVGAFLSGGLDSSAVVAELAGGGDLQTFSIGFEEEAYSELPYAREVARRFGVAHIEEIVRADAASGLDDLITHYDEPFADPSAIPTLAVSRVARRGVKVAVSGDGGDEAFGGYTRYAHDLWEEAIRSRLPEFARKSVLSNVARAWPHAEWLPRPLRLKTALTNLSLDPAEAYANTLSLFRRSQRRLLMRSQELNGYRPENAVTAPYRQGRDALQSMVASDIETLLPDDFLVKVDRASMAVGLEVRPPMVDHEFLELSARIPSRWKVRNGETKWIFKRSQEGRLPHDVIWRKKQGFDIPVDEWLRGPLRDRLESTLLSDGVLDDLLDAKEIRRVCQAHQRGLPNQGRRLWALLVLGEWRRRYASPPASSHSRETPVLGAGT